MDPGDLGSNAVVEGDITAGCMADVISKAYDTSLELGEDTKMREQSVSLKIGVVLF